MSCIFDYCSVTELAGDEVSQEQIDRLCHRYHWAGSFCDGKDVVEAACGTGQGVSYLLHVANSVEAGDFSDAILTIARKHSGDRVTFLQFDATDMPFADDSKDVIILFEAIYYLRSAEQFVTECQRVLRPGGKVLIATANKNLSDFNPSPHSVQYYGAKELAALFAAHNFSCDLFGYMPVDSVPMRQKILRPIKKLAAAWNLIPKSMAGKKFFKRLVFGKLVPMPAEITEDTAPYTPPVPIPTNIPDKKHKVIYCAATLES